MVGLKTLLVPTDFSELSRRALPHAEALALARGAEVVLLHVIATTAYPTYGVVTHDAFPNLEAEMRKRAEEQLEEMCAGLSADLVARHEVRQGITFREVQRSAAHCGADLIVLATHGHSGLKHAVLGSNAEKIVRTSSIPVLSVRGDADHAPGRMQRLIVPTDFTPASLSALDFAFALAPGEQTEIVLVHVHEPPGYPGGLFGAIGVDAGNVEVELRTRVDQSMQELVADRRAQHANLRGAVLDGNAPLGIVRAAEDEAADMIVIATHGYTGLKHVFLGSTAERVVRKAACPVLTVRTDRRRAGEVDGDNP